MRCFSRRYKLAQTKIGLTTTKDADVAYRGIEDGWWMEGIRRAQPAVAMTAAIERGIVYLCFCGT